jgi:HD-GYP domain-containing protein (c-di-GMP phosphodiesterase class II)
MRYIDVSLLEPDMVLGRSLYGTNNERMLKKGQPIKLEYINRIKSLGFQGLYIKDGISDDLDIDDVVSQKIRMEALGRLKDLFIFDEKKDHKHFEETLANINQTVGNMVTEIDGNRNAMINMMDLKIYDEYTFYHCVNVSIIAVAIGCGLGLSHQDLTQLGLAGMLHDIGKQRIPKAILEKEDNLTDEEFKELKKHPAYGYRMMRDCNNISPQVYLSILQHHERIDGSGYPHGKKGDDISLFARIIGVADCYDAIISKRPYHDPILPSDAIEYIMGGSGFLFDPEVVRVFLRKVSAYPVSMCVMLSNGVPAMVVKNFEDANTRPLVKLLKGDIKNPTYINLKDDPNAQNLTIVGVLNI